MQPYLPPIPHIHQHVTLCVPAGSAGAMQATHAWGLLVFCHLDSGGINEEMRVSKKELSIGCGPSQQLKMTEYCNAMARSLVQKPSANNKENSVTRC